MRRYFYTHYGFAPDDPYLESLPKEATPDWRASLSWASWVDAVRVDPIDGMRMGWMHAQITEETGGMFKLDFEHMSEMYSRWLPKDHADIAPYDSKTKTEAVDEQWFDELKPGDLLDCRDPYSKWYNATVLAERMSTYGKEIRVGYRVYVDHGAKMDEDGQRYSGWQEEYDEWLSFFSAPTRFARFNRRVRFACVRVRVRVRACVCVCVCVCVLCLL